MILLFYSCCRGNAHRESAAIR